jgi:hydroxyacylglutathione hydrolase
MPHVVTRPRAPVSVCAGRLTLHQIPAAHDNLIWLLADDAEKTAAAVDGPNAAGVLAYCEAHDLRLTTIFNTHTHHDHIGINVDLAARGQLAALRVVGARARASEIPGLTEPVVDGDSVTFGGVPGRVMLTEGHIDGHVSYVFGEVLLCGDTMFAAGCGYLFDGPPAKMHDSLQRLAALPPETLVCCAHEYTQDNLRFAWSIDPDNEALARRIREVWDLRARGECSVPSTIAVERETNPFLRATVPEIAARLAAAMPDHDVSTPAGAFAAARALKDRKDYRRHEDADLPLAGTGERR